MADSKDPKTSELRIDEIRAVTNLPQKSLPPPPPRKSAKPIQPPQRTHSAAPTTAYESDRPTIEDLNATVSQQSVLSLRAKTLITRFQNDLLSNPDALRAARLHFELAHLFDCHLQNQSKAIEHYKKSLELKSDHLPSIQGLRRIMLDKGQFEEALPLFDRELERTGNVRDKARLLRQKAAVIETSMSEPDKAFEHYCRAFELDNSDHAALLGLDRCARVLGQWDKLDQVYQKRIALIDKESIYRAQQLFERAWIAETQHQPDISAPELYTAALAIDPNHLPARAALKRLHETQENWQSLIEVLTHEAEYTKDIRIKADNYLRIAQLYSEKLSDADNTAQALQKASSVCPQDAVILARLARLYEETARHRAAIGVWERWVSIVEDPTDLVSVSFRIAKIADDLLDDEELAIQWYERTLGIEPSHTASRHRLEQLYRKQQNWDALVGMLLAFARASEDNKERAAVHAKVAGILEEHTKEPNDAIDHHLRALSFVSDYQGSFKALDRLFRSTGRFAELLQLYERLVEEQNDPTEKTELLFAMGGLCENEVKDFAQAALCYKRILGVQKDSLRAIRALQRVLERAKDYKELAEALKLEARLTVEKSRLAQIHNQIGILLFEKLNDLQGATVNLRKALDADETFAPALEQLCLIYTQAGRWEDVLRVLQRQANIETQPKASASLYFEIARLCEYTLGQADQAIRAYAKVIEFDPSHRQGVESLRSLLVKHERWKELSVTLEHLFKHASTASEKAFICLDLASLYEKKLEDLPQAILFYEKAISLQPNLHTANDALIRLRFQQQAWDKLEQRIAHASAATEDLGLAKNHLWHEALVQKSLLNEPKKAEQSLHAVLELDPTHIGSIDELRNVHLETKHWERAAQYAKHLAEHSEQPLLHQAFLQ
ncbi:MAG: tetratricopeptide repeat protein [Myxococcales bacterium]|nr:MAG: tetratricopeptide repeat protein [Myxococcales bacterium]